MGMDREGELGEWRVRRRRVINFLAVAGVIGPSRSVTNK